MNLQLLKIFFFPTARELNANTEFEGHFDANDFPVLVVKFGDQIVPMKIGKKEPSREVLKFYIEKINEAIGIMANPKKEEAEIATEKK